MPASSLESLERKARVIASLAHPSRLLIVEALEEGEKTVSELTGIVGSDISTVSRHLGVLRSAGIIASTEGLEPGPPQASHTLPAKLPSMC